MCGQPTAYNAYATLPYTNPLFMGFSRSQNVNKEIVISAMAEIWKELPSLLEEFFLCFCHHRMAEMSETKQSEVELLSHRRYKVVAWNAIRGQCYGWNYTRYGG